MLATSAYGARIVRIVSIALLFARSHASVMVHYFGQASCNANTAISQYSDPNTVTTETACIAAAPGTVALYVDGVDEGCTVRTYADASCTINLGLSITVGTCYYKDDATIGSWRAVCGAGTGNGNGAGGGAAQPISSSSTVTLSLSIATPTPTVGSAASTPQASSNDALMSEMDVGPVITSVETVTPTMTALPPTDGAPVPTIMPSGAGAGVGNGTGSGSGMNWTDWTDWTYTQSKAEPSVSPGLQGPGNGGMGISGAGARGEWRRDAMRVSGLVGVVALVGGYFVELL